MEPREKVLVASTGPMSWTRCRLSIGQSINSVESLIWNVEPSQVSTRNLRVFAAAEFGPLFVGCSERNGSSPLNQQVA